MVFRLPVFADTEEGRAFAERLWRETVQECRSVVGGDGKGFGEGLVL